MGGSETLPVEKKTAELCPAGKESELKGELVGHTGGIYGLAWDGSSRKLLSASGDKTCR